jgi:hypothetical protein
MDDYTKDDVITALSKIPMNSRQRVLVDQRSYLMGLLAFRFMMAEHAIAKATGIKRDKVNYNKKLVLQFCKDKSYIQNVYVYAQMFPFNFNVIDSSRPNRMKRVELDLDQKFFNKLKVTGSILGHNDIRITIKFLLEKSMKLWEE